MKLVGDNNDGFAVGFHCTHDTEELVRLLRCQNCGGFIENENIRTPVKRLNYLKSLFFGDGHLIDLLVGIDRKAIFLTDSFNALLNIAQLALKPQQDIFGSGEHIDKLKMLMYHSDMKVKCILWGFDDDGHTVDLDASGVGEVDAREHVHKRSLSAAVFAQQ